MNILLLVQAFLAATGAIFKVVNAYYFTPASQWDALNGRLSNLTDNVKSAVEEGKATGDYSRLESVLNRDS